MSTVQYIIACELDDNDPLLLGLFWIYALPGSSAAIVVVLPLLAATLWVMVRYYETKPAPVTLLPQ